MTRVFPLDAQEAGTLALAGGKAVGLHALIRLQLPVPPGFCISAEAFRTALDGAGLGPLIAAADALDPRDDSAVRAHAAKVREAILGLTLAPDLAASICAHWREGLGGASVAVRSSATAEDLDDASFAGQQDTVLGVCEEQGLLDAVRRCWASLFSDRALSYRLSRGISSADASMGVVVQQMVEAETAGVLFTADPSSGSRAVMTIEAVQGLGEALVSGHALPDAWRISKATGQVLEAKLGAGRTEPLLAPAQLRGLVALGCRVEEGRGAPQDLEWAVAEGRCWLVQARAITTLNPLPSPATDDRWRVFLSFGHIQVNTASLSPLMISVVRRLVPFLRDPASGESAIVKEAGTRVYVDATPALVTPAIRARLTSALQSMSRQIADRLESALRRPELKSTHPELARSAVIRRIAPIVARVLWAVIRSEQRVGRNYEIGLEALLRSQQARVDRERGSARLSAMSEVIGGAFESLLLGLAAPLIAQMLIGERLLRRWTRAYAPRLPEDALLRGVEGNLVTQMDLLLGDLADLARPVPELCAALTSPDPAAAVPVLRGREGTDAFFRGWDAFLDRFGHRGAGEIDVAVPRWRDDPSGPLRSIAGQLARPEGAHRTHQAAAREEAERALAEVRSGARRGLFGSLRAWWIARTARRVRFLFNFREHHKDAFVRMLALLRREVLAAGGQLVAVGALERREDLWLVGLSELQDAVRTLEGGGEVTGLHELVARRRQEQARWRRWSPPPVLTSEGEAIAPAATVAAPANTWVGTAVSSGVVEGRVRVVEEPARATLAPGEVLVAPFTDPGWTPLFMHASGLVMEVGGTMTHGSVVARELGIPAVVGIDGVTRKLRTGQRVRVDGDRGWVTVLDEGAEGADVPPAPEPERAAAR